MRLRRLMLLMLFVTVAMALAACARPNDPQSRLKTAQAALEKGDTVTAIRELESITNADPKQVEARVLLGRAYEKANRTDDAINQYQAALTLQSQDPQVGFRLGALLVTAGKPVEAVAPLAAGVKLNAGMAVSYTREISAAVAAGVAAGDALVSKDPQQAAQLLDAIITLDAGNVRARVLLGNLYVSSGQSQPAIEQYKAALALDPKNISAITNMGAAYYQMGKLDDAIAQFRLALQQAPDDAETHYLLGAAYIQQNKVQEAASEFQAAIKSNPNLAAAYIGLGNAQMLQNDLDGAVASLNKAAQLAPNQPEALYALGKALMAKDDKAGARQAFQRFLELNPPASRRAEVDEWLKQLGP
jgi:protein O-GlcNAc transferase